jgi:FixJ family two-component response regulator
VRHDAAPHYEQSDRRLTISGATLPVIFTTTLDDEDRRAQAQKIGCVAFLRKPYSARRLVDAIEKAVS